MKFMKSGGSPEAIEFERKQLEIINKYISRLSDSENEICTDEVISLYEEERRAYGTA